MFWDYCFSFGSLFVVRVSDPFCRSLWYHTTTCLCFAAYLVTRKIYRERFFIEKNRFETIPLLRTSYQINKMLIYCRLWISTRMCVWQIKLANSYWFRLFYYILIFISNWLAARKMNVNEHRTHASRFSVISHYQRLFVWNRKKKSPLNISQSNIDTHGKYTLISFQVTKHTNWLWIDMRFKW